MGASAGLVDTPLRICFYAFMRTTIDLPTELFRKVKARAASRGESLKTVLIRAVAAEVGLGVQREAGSRVALPLFGAGRGRGVDVSNADLARALADDDVRRSRPRRRAR